ncbi:MAG: ribosome maturation factor RimP [Enhygromyxa sp.]
MTRDPHQHHPRQSAARKRGDVERGLASDAPDSPDSEEDSGLGGRHAQATALLEAAVEPLVEDLGYELLRLEWLGSGKRRLMRLYIDSPAGVTIEDCTRLGRILSNALDASEAAAAAEDGEARDPVLAALLGKPYTLEVSSPGVDRPLTRRRHFADHVGGRIKLETWAPLDPSSGQKKFHGRIVAVEEDPAAPDDQRRGVVVVHDTDGDRTLRIPLPRIRRANLVWEG